MSEGSREGWSSVKWRMLVENVGKWLQREREREARLCKAENVESMYSHLLLTLCGFIWDLKIGSFEDVCLAMRAHMGLYRWFIRKNFA